MTPGSLEVIVEDGGEFPEFLVGRWQGDKGGWGFIFEPDGRIFVARIPMGRMEVMPGKIATIPTHGGGEAIYVPGDWSVIYSPSNGELMIDIVMNYIRIETGDYVFEGKTRYILTGTVSEDEQVWRTVVSTFPEYEDLPMAPEDLPHVQEVNLVKMVEEE